MMSQQDFLLSFERYLEQQVFSYNLNPKLLESMRYSALDSGKRIRPLLVYASGKINNLSQEQIMLIAASVEIIHTFSLIHDDLPCMDNDDYRRGKLTNHKVFGEAIALLGADNLHNLAYKIIVQSDIDNASKIKLLDLLIGATERMIEGQVVDMQATNQKITLDELSSMHRNKTGALIEYSCLAPFLLSNNSDLQGLKNMQSIGRNIGLLFQIIDDILDCEASFADLGKTVNKDQMQNKSTYVSILGITQAKQEADNIYSQTLELVKIFQNSELLIQLIDYIYRRKK